MSRRSGRPAHGRGGPHPQPLATAGERVPEHIQEQIEVDNPRSKHEWRAFLLRTLIDLRTGYIDAAYDRTKWTLSRVPFIREKRMFSATLATIDLQQGRCNEAVDASALCSGDVTSIVRLHALASSGHEDDARRLYEILKVDYVPRQYVEVRDEIARAFGTTSG